jgi:hypothetical protein
MKFNKFLAVALTATTLFASCSKENVETENANGDNLSVTIKIAQASNATRAEGASVANSTAVSFTSGSLIFTNPSDVITMVVTVNTGNAVYASTTKSVGIEALADGQQITAVPSASKKVYFVGNAPTGVTFTPGEVLTSKMASVASQWNANGSVANVTIFGGEALTLVAGGEVDEYEAAFNAKAIAARFEIKEIAGTAALPASTLTYKVTGIFIDKYYDQMTLAGVGAAGDVKSNGTTVANYVSGAGSYLTGVSGAVFDYNGTGSLATETQTTPAKDAWAYNLLAPTSSTSAIAMPAIVIRLSDVMVDQTSYGTQFLTIKNFYTDGTNATQITALAQGNVYVIPSIAFDQDDMTPNPHLKDIKATVEVDLVPWVSSSIGYDFN